MYPNLRAEMARNNVSPADISRVAKRTDRSIRDKISGKGDFTLSEVITIRDTFFPEQTLDYLFVRDGDTRESV